MKELAVYEAKTRLSELLLAVEQGEQFVITRRGVAVARLVGAAAGGPRKAKARRRSPTCRACDRAQRSGRRCAK